MIQIIEICKKDAVKTRKRSKTNDTSFGDIPYNKGLKLYKQNKNCAEEYRKIVLAKEREVSLQEKFNG